MRVSVKSSKSSAHLNPASGKYRRAKAIRDRQFRDNATSVRPSATITTMRGDGISPFPNVYRTTLKYLHRGATLVGGAPGAGNYYAFRANSLFDPDYSGVGSQPTGFDEISALYAHYRVIRSKITIWMNSKETADALVGWLTLDSTTATSTSPALPVTRGRCAYAVADPQGGNSTIKLTAYFDGAKFFGRSWDDRDHQAAVGGNPTEDVYFTFGFAPLDTVTTPTNGVDIMAVMEFDAEFTEPLNLPSS